MKTTFNILWQEKLILIRSCLILISAIILMCSSKQVLAVEDQQSLANQINRASVLYQPLMWVGNEPPSENEDVILLSNINEMKKRGASAEIPNLQQFVSTFTNSPWRPSLEANLGRYYFEHGLYTEALENWESAWALTKAAKDGRGKQIADFTFAYWTHLLASLGRTDTLRKLYLETDGRAFDGGPLQQIINGAKEGYYMMKSDPGVCYKCGTFALFNLAQALRGRDFALTNRQLLEIPSPETGFKMTQLLELSKKYHLNLAAAEWGVDKTLVIPSIIHWRENHYVAVIKQKGNMVLVNDPTFGKPRWLKAEDVKSEASGYFVVSSEQLPNAWRILNKNETDEIYGKGYVDGTPDGDDGCGNGSGGSNPGAGSNGPGSGSVGASPASSSGGVGVSGASPQDSSSGSGSGGVVSKCKSCGSGGGTGGTGGGGSACCSGMTIWEVSEPYINVWLYDEPLGYQPALGPRVSFKLAYKQRETLGISPNFFSFGPMWECFWLSYVLDDGGGTTATMVVPGGGQRTYTCDNATKEYYSNTIMQRTTDGSGNLTGFIITYANGAKDYYQFVPSELMSANQVAFLTLRMDANGHETSLIYNDNTNASLTTLNYIIDTDGRTNTFNYGNATYPAQVTSIQDPFLRTTYLQYDAYGNLTNIEDAIGIKSSFQYDWQGWVTNLNTPYGKTTFQYYTNNSEPAVGEFGNGYDGIYDPYLPVRAVTVIDADNGTNIYMLRQDSSELYTNENDFYTNSGNYVSFIPSSYSSSVVPACVEPDPIGFGSFCFDNIYLNYRDSFHWGPKQAVGLPSDITTFAPTDFIKARMCHWMHGNSAYSPDQDNQISQTLDMEQEPSPDGISAGQTTWYGYTSAYVYQGSCSQPSAIAKVLPDGTEWYQISTRDNWGRPTNIISTYSTCYGAAPMTRTNAYIYDANDINIVQVIDALNETNSFGYDANNNLLAITNAVGDVTSFTYDAVGRKTSTAWSTGAVTTNIYYGSGLYSNYLQETIDLSINRTNHYSYTNDLVYLNTDERGLAKIYGNDNLNRLISVTYPDGSYVSNSFNRLDLVQTSDRLGFTTSYEYDSLRRNISITNANGAVTHFNYCTCGALDSIEDAEGNLTSFTYNNAGWRLSAYYSDGYSIDYNYDLLGNATNIVDSSGASTTNWFNNQNLLYAKDSSAGQIAFFAFDAADHVLTNIEANNVATVMSYDSLGRITSRSYPDGGVELYGYSSGSSGPTSYTNQIGNIIRYAYDGMSRKTNEATLGVTTNQFVYDGAGDLISLTDGKNQTTTWEYDQFGRVTNKVDAAHNLLFVYKYDPDNRLTNRWSAAKGATTYAYDPVGNLTNVDYSGASSPMANVSLAYDLLNRLTSMVDAVGKTEYGYDQVGQLLSEGGLWPNDTVSFTYANRLRSGLSIQAPNAPSWSQFYGYDNARRLTSVRSPAGSFNYIYDPVELQRVDELTLPNGAVITNAFDSEARLLSTTLINSSSTVLDSQYYGYNQASQRTSETNAPGDFRNYAYDNAGELISALGHEAGGTTNRWQEQYGYGYDAAGNLNNRTNNTLVQNFGVNTLNELTEITNAGSLTVAGTTTSPATNVMVNSLASALYADTTFASTNQPWVSGNNTYTAIAHDVYGRVSTSAITVALHTTNGFTYDLNGNLLADGTRNFAYDDENQLVSVWVANTWSNNFVYDGKLRRRIERDYSWTGSWTETNEVHFIYDGNVVVQERNANNLPTVTYTRGNDLSGSLQGAGGIGGLLARSDNTQMIIGNSSAHAYYHSDGNGNVTMLINNLQGIAAKYLYDSFGNTLSMSGPLASANVYRFSSKEWNANSGLYYYLYRFYDPQLQRWPNRDPLLESGFTILSMRQNILPTSNPLAALSDAENLFEFCANDPIASVDPKGTQLSGILRVIVPRMFPKYNLGGSYIPGSCNLTNSKKSCAPVGPNATVCTYSCTEGGYSDESNRIGPAYNLTTTVALGQTCSSSINPPMPSMPTDW